ncbi:transposase [Blautia wexlerae]
MDHQVLLQIIKTSLSKYNCWLHAYCLMTNHVHLLLETG